MAKIELASIHPLSPKSSFHRRKCGLKPTGGVVAYHVMISLSVATIGTGRARLYAPYPRHASSTLNPEFTAVIIHPTLERKRKRRLYSSLAMQTMETAWIGQESAIS